MQKTIKPSRELIQAAKNVFVAMAYVQTIRPTIEAIQTEALELGQYRTEEEGEEGRIILNPKDAYLLKDEDFKAYYAKCYEGYLTKGFQVEFEYCPLLIAESEVRKAERELVIKSQELHDLFDAKAVLTSSKRKEYIELTLKFLAPFVK